MTTTSATLGAYAAKTCGFQVYLDHAPFSRGLPLDQQAAMFSGLAVEGVAYEDEVFERLIAAYGEDCVHITLDTEEQRLPYSEQRALRQARTAAAMAAGVRVICGGSLVGPSGLPLELATGLGALQVVLTGDPDILVRQTSRDGSADAATYLPIDIKHHKTLNSKKKAPFAYTGPLDLLADPFEVAQAPLTGYSSSYRIKDGLQLAHYTRLLEAIGRHPGVLQHWGGIIGSDHPLTDLRVTWLDLDDGADEPLLVRYDREIALRHDALQQAHSDQRYVTGSLEAVRAGRYGKAECSGCARRTTCRTDAGAQDVSFLLTVGRPNGPAWEYLYEQGASTPATLADLDVVVHEPAYKAAGKTGTGNAAPLVEVVERARMHRDGEFLRRRPGAAAEPVPTFDVEIDFDIEWGLDQLVYQWGASIRTAQDDSTVTYEHSLYRFAELTRPEAEDLAAEFFAGLDAVIEQARLGGKTVGLFHWTSPEQWQTKKFLGEALTARYGPELVFDLKQWVERGYVARDGYSLKKIAPACRFAWDVDDAGGDMSIVMINRYRAATTDTERAEAERWLIQYNDSDCRAQAKIRDYLRDLPEVVTVLETRP